MILSQTLMILSLESKCDDTCPRVEGCDAPGRRHAALRPSTVDMALLSPLGHEHINVLGRYSFALDDGISQGELRPWRHPGERKDLTVGVAWRTFLLR
jgi:hypothetical protein